MNFLRRKVAAWEDEPLAGWAWFFSLLAIILLRNVLEGLLEAEHNWSVRVALRPGLIDLMHIIAAWLCVYLPATLALTCLRGAALVKVGRVTLRFFPLILSVPVIDALLGQAGHIRYNNDFHLFLDSFVGLFLPWREISYVTPGVRIEILLGAVAAGMYLVLMRPGAWLRALQAAFLIYSIPFLLGFLPAAWAALSGSSSDALARSSVLQVDAPEAALIWYLPILIPCAVVWLRLASPIAWRVVADCLRPSRLLVYLVLLNGGFVLASSQDIIGNAWRNPYDIGELVLLNFALSAAFVAQVALNDLFDLLIDRTSNAKRPLASGQAPATLYYAVAGLGSALALALALVVDDVAVYPMLGLLALGWLYSAPPFRLRRFIGLAHLTLASIGCGCFLLGATLVHGNLAYQRSDATLLVLLAALYLAAVQFKDLKDVDGDRAQGVTTLATLLGPTKAYWLAGVLVMAVALAGLGTGLVHPTLWTWLAMAVFGLAWLVLRDGERVLRASAIALALFLLGLNGA